MVGGSVKGARGGHTFQKPLARLRLIESYFKKIISTYPHVVGGLTGGYPTLDNSPPEQDLTLQ